MVNRKGPGRVVRFDSGAQPKTVTQAEVAEVSMLQAAAFQAEQVMQRSILKIEKRLQRGARLEDGPLMFDSGLRMVRTRRAG